MFTQFKNMNLNWKQTWSFMPTNTSRGKSVDSTAGKAEIKMVSDCRA